MVIIWTLKLWRARVPIATYQTSRSLALWFWRRRFLKVFFTIYGHGGHFGHVTQTPRTNFRSPIPLRLHMKFGFDRPSRFGEDLWQVAQRATIAHLSPMCQGQISFKKIRTHPSFNACSYYMKVSKGSNQNQQRKKGNTIFPIISLWGYFLDAQGQLTP